MLKSADGQVLTQFMSYKPKGSIYTLKAITTYTLLPFNRQVNLALSLELSASASILWDVQSPNYTATINMNSYHTKLCRRALAEYRVNCYITETLRMLFLVQNVVSLFAILNVSKQT